MNQFKAMQPPHLNGLWQYALLNSTGGGPICGCTFDEGHATREEAERHLYETNMANAFVHQWNDPDEQRRCERCGDWTTHRVTIRVHHIHDNVHVLCPAHAVGLGEGEVRPQRSTLEQMVPFAPGIESWGNT